MDEGLHTTLGVWGDFYLITGSAAAALTGLQFVVQTLIASDLERTMTGTDPEGGIAAFGTPTVVHFALALVVSALLCVPWPGYGSLGATLGVLSLAALVYSGVTLQRARRQTGYVTTAYDWVWYFALPAVAYVALVVAALILRSGTGPFFVIAAATLLLLCVGIHNAWDTVTFLTITALRRDAPMAPDPTPPKSDNAGAPAA